MRSQEIHSSAAPTIGIALAAVYARSDRLRNAIGGVPSLFISVPAFWLGIVLIQNVSFQLGWVPVIGGEDWQKLILPVLTLAVPVSSGTPSSPTSGSPTTCSSRPVPSSVPAQ